MTSLRHTWYMVGRQTRNLLREPILIAILLVQPMVWRPLYGQLFKNVTRLGGFGTSSYITFLAPAIVVMNAFFSASWSGMSMVFDIERKFVERFLGDARVAGFARALVDRPLVAHGGDPAVVIILRSRSHSVCAVARVRSAGW